MTLVNIVSISYPNRATIASMMIAAMTAPKPAACFLCFDSAKAAEIGAHHRPRAKCIGPTNSGGASSIRPMMRGEKKNGTDKPTCRIATPSVSSHRDRPRSGLEKNIWRDVIGGFRQMVENSGAGGGVTSLQSAAHASRASADVRAEAS